MDLFKRKLAWQAVFVEGFAGIGESNARDMELRTRPSEDFAKINEIASLKSQGLEKGQDVG